MTACVCGADEPCQVNCSKHNTISHGYPCLECQREWEAANPERVAEIERMVNKIMGRKP